MPIRHLIRSLFVLLATTAMAVEVPISDPVYGPAPSNQYQAAAASNGDQYLAVWADQRAQVNQLYATRLSGDGTVLDRNGIRVASGALTYYPSVIWGGNSWFVVSNNCRGIEFVRVAASGAVLDAKPRVLPIQAWCPGMSLASNGQSVAIGYVTGYSTYEYRALIVDKDGESIADVLLSTSQSLNKTLAVAWDGSSFVAVWGEGAVRFDRTGVLGPVRSVSFAGSASGRLEIVFDGRDFLVTSGSIAFRMSADFVVAPLTTLPFSYVQSIHWTGASYAIAGVVPFIENGHENTGRINIVLMDREGRILGQREMQTEGGYGARPVATTNGRNVVVVWDDPTEAEHATYEDKDTFAAIVSLPDFTLAPRQLLSRAAGWQFGPSTAVSTGNQLTVWKESTGVYARRHWRDGTADASPLRLSEAFSSSTAVVFDGSDYIVASAEGTSVVIRRLPASGPQRVDREIRTAGGQRPESVALARDGETTLVAWFDNGIFAARIGADGSWIDDIPLEVAPAALASATHRIVISPNRSGEFLVVWGGSLPECICSPYGPPEGSPLRAARVTSTLTLLDHPPIDIAIPLGPFDSASNPSSPRYNPEHSLFVDHPSVTWNGSEWLVVWNRAFHDTSAEILREEIRGRRIARNGTLLDGSSRDPGIIIARDAFAPTVEWTGAAYLLAWYEGVPAYRTSQVAESLLRIRTATLGRTGAPLSNERTLGESSDAYPVSIAIASGFTSIAYTRLGEDSRYGGVPRVFLDMTRSGDSRRRSVGK